MFKDLIVPVHKWKTALLPQNSLNNNKNKKKKKKKNKEISVDRWGRQAVVSATPGKNLGWVGSSKSLEQLAQVEVACDNKFMGEGRHGPAAQEPRAKKATYLSPQLLHGHPHFCVLLFVKHASWYQVLKLSPTAAQKGKSQPRPVAPPAGTQPGPN